MGYPAPSTPDNQYGEDRDCALPERKQTRAVYSDGRREFEAVSVQEDWAGCEFVQQHCINSLTVLFLSSMAITCILLFFFLLCVARSWRLGMFFIDDRDIAILDGLLFEDIRESKGDYVMDWA